MANTFVSFCKEIFFRKAKQNNVLVSVSFMTNSICSFWSLLLLLGYFVLDNLSRMGCNVSDLQTRNRLCDVRKIIEMEENIGGMMQETNILRNIVRIKLTMAKQLEYAVMLLVNVKTSVYRNIWSTVSTVKNKANSKLRMII